MSSPLLVVAGEASGDRAGAGVVQALAAMTPLRAVGMGGAALAAAGVSLLGDLRQMTAMGIGAVASNAAKHLAMAYRLTAAAKREKVTTALLVNYTEFNTHLAAHLHPAGIHVVWYGAPQVWAWRPGRAAALRASVDRMAVMLPFEEPLWREHGVDARYVGHPALETSALSHHEARALLGLTDLAKTVAILPGSRAHEVRALLEPMLGAFQRVRRDRASIDARVLVASSLDFETRAWVRKQAAGAQISTFDVPALAGAGVVLRAFDVALTASGTATLECALAGVIPVMAYRVGPVTELAARILVGRRCFSLPNVLLDRHVFPELLQRDVTAKKLASALGKAIDSRRDLLVACEEVRSVLGGGRHPSRDVAAMLLPWIGEPKRA